MDTNDCYCITNELLNAAMHGNQYGKCRFLGYMTATICPLGRSFLEYCICKIYGIHRLPGFGYDNYYTPIMPKELETFESLSEKDVSDACKEFEAMIKHVQQRLIADGHVKNGKVKLSRKLRDWELPEAIYQLNGNEDMIYKHFNILTSFAHYRAGYSAYSAPRDIYLEHEFDLDDIVFWDDYVSRNRGSDECPRICRLSDSECEVLIKTDALTGKRIFHRDQFLVDGDISDYSTPNRYVYNPYHTASNHDGAASVFQQKVILPCQKGLITSSLVARNETKLKKMAEKA